MPALTDRNSIGLYAAFALAILANILFWLYSKDVRSVWSNVPPTPENHTAGFSTLADDSMGYRMTGYFLQNLGNVGGQYQSLKDYDYEALQPWLFLSRTLDPQSDYVPFLAAYYFGAVEGEPEKIRALIPYLTAIGEEPYPQKWRWLARAVYLARYTLNDLPLALELAHRLAALKTDVAPWARQMPAFIQLQLGNKEAAYEIMVRIMATEGSNIHPNEVRFMRDFICDKTLDKAEAAKNPLCQSAP